MSMTGFRLLVVFVKIQSFSANKSFIKPFISPPSFICVEQSTKHWLYIYSTGFICTSESKFIVSGCKVFSSMPDEGPSFKQCFQINLWHAKIVCWAKIQKISRSAKCPAVTHTGDGMQHCWELITQLNSTLFIQHLSYTCAAQSASTEQD